MKEEPFMGHFKDSTVYQIYTKSFQDTTGNGLGDIRGVISRLDYLKELGIDYIWLTPFFSSPLNDNGYDVADYRAVDPVFGTMEDVEELIWEADIRGMGCMFDMVFNHCDFVPGLYSHPGIIGTNHKLRSLLSQSFLLFPHPLFKREFLIVHGGKLGGSLVIRGHDCQSKTRLS